MTDAEKQKLVELLDGGGKFRQHLTYQCLDDVVAKVVKRFVKAASKLGAK